MSFELFLFILCAENNPLYWFRLIKWLASVMSWTQFNFHSRRRLNWSRRLDDRSNIIGLCIMCCWCSYEYYHSLSWQIYSIHTAGRHRQVYHAFSLSYRCRCHSHYCCEGILCTAVIVIFTGPPFHKIDETIEQYFYFSYKQENICRHADRRSMSLSSL